MSSALKICGSVLRSRSIWSSSSTRLMGDKTPSTGIPCLGDAECPKPCQEENSTCPKPGPEKASCPESCPEGNESLPKDVCMQNDKCPKDECVAEERMEETSQDKECEEEDACEEEEECQEDQMDVPGLSTAVLCVPEGDVGPGASKCGDYKNPEYFSFHRMSYHEAEVEMACYRNTQPSAKAKKADEPEQ